MPHSKGHLNPGSPGVSLDRFALGDDLSELVRHVWIARWDLPPGAISRQRVLTYPAFNIVVMGPNAMLYGPNPKVYVRELSGRGWAVGILLRPAAAPVFATVAPQLLVAKSEPMAGAPWGEIAAAMESGAVPAQLSSVIERWLAPMASRVDEHGRLANRICRLVEDDRELVRVSDVAARMDLSSRALERVVRKYIGVTPKWLIECRRLQDAATTLFAAPDTHLTQLAMDLGYVDHAHFCRRYKAVLGETPDETRASAKAARAGR